MNNKTWVIHHSADFDGVFCREIARKFLPNANLIGWDYRDDKITFPTGGDVYVLDLSPSCFIDLPISAHSRLIWIDHHKTSMEEWGNEFVGYRIDGVAACRLTWQWFQEPYSTRQIHNYPHKEEYINRTVKEPLSVRLAGEYDIWDKRDPNAELFQHSLRSEDLTPTLWSALLDQYEEFIVQKLLGQGKAIQYSSQKADIGTMNRSFIVNFEGLKLLTLNTARCNSLTFASKDHVANGHDALCGFYFDGKKWNISLYHAKHRTDLDLSEIAKKHGGGGHRGACGFQKVHYPF